MEAKKIIILQNEKSTVGSTPKRAPSLTKPKASIDSGNGEEGQQR